MPFGQSGNSRNEGAATPAPAPNANDGQATTTAAAKSSPDDMVKGLAFVSMTHNREGGNDDSGDEGNPPPQSKQADEDTESGEPGDGGEDASTKGAPAAKAAANDDPPEYITALQSQIMAMQAELQQWRNGQQPQAQQQKTEEKPAKKAHVNLTFDGEPEEFISRQELYDRERQLIDSINHSFGNAYQGILGSEKQRFYSDMRRPASNTARRLLMLRSLNRKRMRYGASTNRTRILTASASNGKTALTPCLSSATTTTPQAQAPSS